MRLMQVVGVPEGFELESDHALEPGAKNLTARITSVPGFELSVPLNVRISHKDETWSAAYDGWIGMGRDGQTPEEAAYTLFHHVILSLRRNYVETPARWHESAIPDGQYLRDTIKPLSD